MSVASNKNGLAMMAILVFASWLMVWAAGSIAMGQESGNPLRNRSEDSGLADSQSRLAEKYDRLELLAGRLAELSRATQPRRAKLLRDFVSKSREKDIPGRFDVVVEALRQSRLASAMEGQGGLHSELQQLLELLLQEDRDRQIESQRKRIHKYLADLKKLIRLQRGIKARTEGGDDQQSLSDDQKRTAEQTDKLRDQIESTEGSRKSSGDQKGKPGGKKQTPGSSSETPPSDSPSSGDQPPTEGKSGEPSPGGGSSPSQKESSDQKKSEDQPKQPADRATERLRQAQQRMQQAIEQLEDAQRDSAADEQEQALRELEIAKAELERLLRQLREEELERMLVLLEARFRKMLAEQTDVYEKTKSLDAAQTQPHELEIASGRLSRREQGIVRDADRALILLREDGTSVAFPEAIEQARDDMRAIAKRLGEVKLSAITQALEEDVILALEETLAALQQAIKELREQRASGQGGGGKPGEQPLVDQLAELRMIRSLQVRINRRTTRYGKMIEGEQALEAELLEALNHLAERQQRVFQATRDLHRGANQ